jgi:predicted dehydrogenase
MAAAAAADPVVAQGEFPFAVAFLSHSHINGQAGGLVDAGGTLTRVFDPDPGKVAAFRKRFPQAQPADSFEQILDDPEIHLVASAAIPDTRAAIGAQVLAAGKDYFTDKGPFTTLGQLAASRAAVAETGRKYLVYYGERLHNAPTWEACELARNGAIGRVLQVLIMAPHNLDNEARPPWFYDKSRMGGILTDIGSHQFEQFLYVAGAARGQVNFARVANLGHPEFPGMEDFGEASVTLDTGTSAYCRVDWFNPRASRTWGDGRAFILGTDGYIEVRKNVDAGNPAGGPRVILINHDEERTITFDGSEPFPFFGRMILDCLHRTEEAMTQEHAFAVAELTLQAQAVADAAAS